MLYEDKIWVGGPLERPVFMEAAMLNRHGLIAGATGTGKTVTVKMLAESLSDAGIPVFLADVKGDLAALAKAGADDARMLEIRQRMGLSDAIFRYKAFPVNFWDLYGEQGTPLRTTVSELGPLLLARVLGLNEVQSGVLAMVFRYADDSGLLLLDLKDLRALLSEVAERAGELRAQYGNISPATVGAIARALLVLEDAGGRDFFGEPALQIPDLMQVATTGQAFINILDGGRLFSHPSLYSTFLLWLLSELFENLPEVGDAAKPRLVFFFDEAHLLFDDMSKELLQKVEQVVKLIRSKGVGIFFCTQNPADIPAEILAQLGNKVQHALRAYTPAEQRAVRAAADSYRSNPLFDTQRALTELGTGEALVSTLDAKGAPTVVERCFILPPMSQFGVLDVDYRRLINDTTPFKHKYGTPVDRESAYEILRGGLEAERAARGREGGELQARKEALAERKLSLEEERLETRRLREAQRLEQAEEAAEMRRLREAQRQQDREERRQERQRQSSFITRATNSAVSSVGRELGRQLVRGILGGFKR